MGRTAIVPEGITSLQRPTDTTHEHAHAYYIKYIKLQCVVVVALAALCIGNFGVLSWHITQSVFRQDQVITTKHLETIQTKIEHNYEVVNYLLNKYQQIEDNNEKANETVDSIRNEDIRKLEAGANGFAEDLIDLQERSNDNVNILQKIQEDVGVLTDNITSLQEDFKTCLVEVGSLHDELRSYGEDLQELKAKYMYQNWTAEVEANDCDDLSAINKSAVSGIYTIYSNFSKSSISVYCEMTTHGDGWIVIQRRQDGSEDFYRGWQEYKRGFGKLNLEFWLGLDNIHALVSDGKWELLINMTDDVKGEVYATYKTFSVGPESEGYVLTIGDYMGDAGDSLYYHNGMKFTTNDNDNDNSSNNCAVGYTGAWWYYFCHKSNLNGVYGITGNEGLIWSSLSQSDPVEFVEMKIKRKL